MDRFLTEEEIRKLDSECTPQDWDILKNAINSVADIGLSGNEEYSVSLSIKLNDANFIAAAPQIAKQYLELLQEHKRYQEEACRSAFTQGELHSETYSRCLLLEQENQRLREALEFKAKVREALEETTKEKENVRIEEN